MPESAKVTTDFLNAQRSRWALADCNYRALDAVVTRCIELDGFPITLQHNPGRVQSTVAKVTAEEVKQRPCFLCASNRPEEQQAIPFGSSRDYELLVNPFPIAPQHFTIAATDHLHQNLIDFGDMDLFVKTYPRLAAFYNGASAGASAPDHLHFQACNLDFLSAIINHAHTEKKLLKHTPDCDIYALPQLPMNAIYFVADGMNDEIGKWLDNLLPTDASSLAPNLGMRNILMWREAGLTRILFFPRSRHRPACYYSDGPDRRLISPGAIDMAGIIILPRQEDFELLTPADLRKVYDEVSFYYADSPAFPQLMML